MYSKLDRSGGLRRKTEGPRSQVLECAELGLLISRDIIAKRIRESDERGIPSLNVCENRSRREKDHLQFCHIAWVERVEEEMYFRAGGCSRACSLASVTVPMLLATRDKLHLTSAEMIPRCMGRCYQYDRYVDVLLARPELSYLAAPVDPCSPGISACCELTTPNMHWASCTILSQVEYCDSSITPQYASPRISWFPQRGMTWVAY